MSLPLLPVPHHLDLLADAEAWTWPASLAPLLAGPDATALAALAEQVGADLAADAADRAAAYPSAAAAVPAPAAVSTVAAPVWSLRLGAATPPATASPADGPEAYALTVDATGVAASATSRAGLRHAWQTLRQLRRIAPTATDGAATLPGVRISDAPDLPWRMYHLDLKGTRRSLADMHAILPRLSELKVNALLVEYEDYLPLHRHPSLAIPAAPTQGEWRAWIAAAAALDIAVVPLVQTLGHWQYILRHPAYAPLSEVDGDPGEGCSSLPATWDLARDMLDEIMDLHPTAPFIHLGLDETHHIGTCPRCLARIPEGGSRFDLYVDWLNRVGDYVRARGFTPMAWADVVVTHLTEPQLARLDRRVVLLDWEYTATGPTAIWARYHGQRMSRKWLERPNQVDVGSLHSATHSAGSRYLEDLPAEALAMVREELDNPEYPLRVRTGHGLAVLRGRGFPGGGVSGIRISAHGCMISGIHQGHLNTIMWADHCRRTGAEVLIGSSWARGHSLTRANAHPDLDWYGIATLGESGWRPLPETALRDFDVRFARQFFGQPDGRIGDLYFQWFRTSSRSDHRMDSYLEGIAAAAAELDAVTTRHRDLFALFRACVDVVRMVHRGQFAMLEIEYFAPVWDRLPPTWKARIDGDITTLLAEMDRTQPALEARYGKSLTPTDAKELATTQFSYLRTCLMDHRARYLRSSP